MSHEANLWSKRFAKFTWVVFRLSFLNGTVSFLRNFTLKRLLLLLMTWKIFFFTISRLGHKFIGPLTYVVLKTVSSLMADWNVVSNPKFLMLFHASSYIFGIKNVTECAIFYSPLLDLKLKHHLIGKFNSWGHTWCLKERPLKVWIIP